MKHNSTIVFSLPDVVCRSSVFGFVCADEWWALTCVLLAFTLQLLTSRSTWTISCFYIVETVVSLVGIQYNFLGDGFCCLMGIVLANSCLYCLRWSYSIAPAHQVHFTAAIRIIGLVLITVAPLMMFDTLIRHELSTYQTHITPVLLASVYILNLWIYYWCIGLDYRWWWRPCVVFAGAQTMTLTFMSASSQTPYDLWFEPLTPPPHQLKRLLIVWSVVAGTLMSSMVFPYTHTFLQIFFHSFLLVLFYGGWAFGHFLTIWAAHKTDQPMLYSINQCDTDSSSEVSDP